MQEVIVYFEIKKIKCGSKCNGNSDLIETENSMVIGMDEMGEGTFFCLFLFF